ncbi:MAG: hypothetical protein KC466_12615, partial [Myxococcales bacterium]|nr:hypothetical protein [Myxococcales bacterium]
MSGAEGRLRLADVARGVLGFWARRPPLHRALPILIRKDPGAPLSVGRFVERAARRWPERPAIKFEDRVLTYADFNARA